MLGYMDSPGAFAVRYAWVPGLPDGGVLHLRGAAAVHLTWLPQTAKARTDEEMERKRNQ